jgi:glutathione S-transferase
MLLQSKTPGNSVTSHTMPAPTLYGFRLSQPVRVVEWFLLLNDIPYQFQLVDLATAEQRKPPYLAINPNHRIPALKDSDGTVVTESNAIMYYLREKYGDKKHLWQGSGDLKTRLRVLEFLSWYPGGLRAPLESFLFPGSAVPKDFGAPIPDSAAQTKLFKAAEEAIRLVNDNWLQTGHIVGDTPTVADLQAYSELQQMAHFAHFDYSPYPNVRPRDCPLL